MMDFGGLFDGINRGINSVAGTAGNVIDARARLAALRKSNAPVQAAPVQAAPVPVAPAGGSNKNMLLLGAAGLLAAVLVFRLARR